MWRVCAPPPDAGTEWIRTAVASGKAGCQSSRGGGTAVGRAEEGAVGLVARGETEEGGGRHGEGWKGEQAAVLELRMR